MHDGPFVSVDPACRHGLPTVRATRLPVASVVDNILAGFDVETVMDTYAISRADVLCACWYAGRYGSRRDRRILGDWATDAGATMWHATDCDYDAILDPPSA